MFDSDMPGSVPGDLGSAVPLERLEAQICELAGHLTAATCRFLVLLGDFDARRGWASWDMSSCAAWLSWKCQMTAGTAREHVRVARALRDLPVLQGEFAAGRLSYAKVRALTRIATPATEAGLAEIAGPMTGNQLERFARAHRQVSHADDTTARIQRRLTWRLEDDGSMAGSFRLPPLAGAVLLKALRAAAGDGEHPHDPEPSRPGDPQADVSAETPAPGAPTAKLPPDGGLATDAPPAIGPATGTPPGGPPVVATSSALADALLTIAEAFLAGKVAVAADDVEVYQVVVHVGTDALAGPGDASGVSAETPGAPLMPGDPADPARCHVEDGPAISVTTAQMIGCTAALSWMRHDRGGAILDLGRRRRRPNAALRRAARERDKCRCRFPGCETRRVDLHHIQFWSNGGRTSLENMISLCKYHHMLVHDRGYLIATARDGTFAFYRQDGTAIPHSPPLPASEGTIGDCHDADITPETIIPPWYGERLDLDHAIYVCFANARTSRERQAGQERQAARGRVQVYGPEGWADRMRRYYDEHPRGSGRVIQPVPV